MKTAEEILKLRDEMDELALELKPAGKLLKGTETYPSAKAIEDALAELELASASLKPALLRIEGARSVLIARKKGEIVRDKHVLSALGKLQTACTSAGNAASTAKSAVKDNRLFLEAAQADLELEFEAAKAEAEAKLAAEKAAAETGK